MSFAVRIAICAAVCSAVTAGFSVTPRSESYSMEYVATGMGGGVSSSEKYSLVGYTDDTGSAGVASSLTYSLEPAVGASESPRAAVSCWTLY